MWIKMKLLSHHLKVQPEISAQIMLVRLWLVLIFGIVFYFLVRQNRVWIIFVNDFLPQIGTDISSS